MASPEEWRCASQNPFACIGLQFADDAILLGRSYRLGSIADARRGVWPVYRGGERAALARIGVAYKRVPPRETLSVLERAARDWAADRRPLAMIRLAHIDLAKCKDDPRDRLAFVDDLLEKRVPPEEILQALGSALAELGRIGKGDSDRLSEPRRPAGDPCGGQWTKETVTTRPANGAYRVVHSWPHKEVVRNDGSKIKDPESTTKSLIAPPNADLFHVYEDGTNYRFDSARSDDENLAYVQSYLSALYTNFRQGGVYDFQRDPRRMEVDPDFANVANYGVGVFLNGAGASLFIARTISSLYAVVRSTGSNSKRLSWLTCGWNDARAGYWIRNPQKFA